MNDRNLGVRDIDYELLHHYVKIFEKKNNYNLFEYPKGIYRLLEGIEKQRKVLSSNKTASINLECLFEDYDLYENLKREDLEKLGSETINRFR